MNWSPVKFVSVEDQLPDGQRRQHRDLGRREVEPVGQEVVGQVEELEASEDRKKFEDLGPLGQQVVGQVQLGDVGQPAGVDAVGTW